MLYQKSIPVDIYVNNVLTIDNAKIIQNDLEQTKLKLHQLYGEFAIILYADKDKNVIGFSIDNRDYFYDPMPNIAKIYIYKDIDTNLLEIVRSYLTLNDNFSGLNPDAYLLFGTNPFTQRNLIQLGDQLRIKLTTLLI
jgi:hypothetical protein